MADPTTDPLLREIDEELRHDQLLKLWKRYGRFIVAAVALVLIGVAGYQYWQHRTEMRRAAASQTLVTATQNAETDPAGSLDRLKSIVDSGPSGHAVLARFQEAALLAQSGDEAGAAEVYRTIAETAPEQILRDLARMLHGILLLDRANDPVIAEESRGLLAPLTADDSPWRYSAREAVAILDLLVGKVADGRQALTALAGDPSAPAGVRERAGQLLTQAENP
jgi:hypothetical protein